MTEMVTASKDFLLTESTINAKAPIGEIMEFLRKARTHGELVVTLNQGGVIGYKVVERTRAGSTESDKMRAAIKMGIDTK